MHSAPCTNTSSSMSGHCCRMPSISSRLSSRERMMRARPMRCQNFTAIAFTVLACTERWMGMPGQRSRTSMMRPGSAMMSASGSRAITGSMSRR